MLAGCALATGCGVQATAGWQRQSERPSRPGSTAALGVRLVEPRGHGPFAGADLFLSTPIAGDRLAVRHLLTSTGYRFRLADVTLEVGADFGAGQPAIDDAEGTGFYLGAQAAPLLRLSGTHDQRPGYAVGGALVDLVAIARLGVWSHPDPTSRSERIDAGLQIGVRITGISDLVVSEDGGWEAP